MIRKLANDTINQRIEYLFDIKNRNFWLIYFHMLLGDDLKGKNNWIDFEIVIKYVVKMIDKVIKENGMGIKNNNISNIGDSIITTAINLTTKSLSNYKDIIKILDEDLQSLIYCLEIYLEEFINDGNIDKVSPDILDLSIDKVLSYNYTKIFEQIYDINRVIDYDYIHGKANINNTIETNNMVLGIDEYLPKERRNKDVEFIAFKKYYQRIHKQTGCKYKEWVDQIKEDWLKKPEDSKAEIRKCISVGDLKNEKIHNLYIFGHSLDITDGDILCDLILNDNVHTIIFYHNKDAMGRQIANLVKVIRQDELIKRTGGRTKTIEFKQQQDMVIKSL